MFSLLYLRTVNFVRDQPTVSIIVCNFISRIRIIAAAISTRGIKINVIFCILCANYASEIVRMILARYSPNVLVCIRFIRSMF